MPLRRVWQVAGHGGLIMRNLPNESAAYWPDGAYSPREPGGTMQDRNGWCMGNHEKRHSCLRDLHIADPRGGAATRFSYQFLTQSNSTWELGLSGRQLGEAVCGQVAEVARAMGNAPRLLRRWLSGSPLATASPPGRLPPRSRSNRSRSRPIAC